ncbi:MAG: signal recognition particle-docking protein FtsY [Treponemataceae bacterium]|nr:signal recognition particle-docking protein FtsY [Treponemataceae bacterium]
MAKNGFSEKLKSLFSHKSELSDEFFEDLADVLIEGDLGAKTAYELSEQAEKECRKNGIVTQEGVYDVLKQNIRSFVKEIKLEPPEGKTSIYLMLGVNGVGKTTTAAKLGRYFENNGVKPIVLAAADTFRAAAIEQLQYHGEQLKLRVVAHQDGSDPGAVVFDAADAVSSQGGGLVIADTAGRLHNKENLVRELQKIDRIASQKASEGCYKKILVIDATTGQNALRQAEVFHEAVGVDAVVLTKYDSTARGGVAALVGKELNLPVAFVGTGEKYEDLNLFDADFYVETFVGE